MTSQQTQLVVRQTVALAKVRGIGAGLILWAIKGILPDLIQMILELLSAQPQLTASGVTSQPTYKDVADVIRNTK